MKRYLIFSGQLVALGGWADFRHHESDLMEATQIAQRYEWAQVVDTTQMKIVFSGKKMTVNGPNGKEVKWVPDKL